MCKLRSTWSHSFPVLVSRSLQVSLLASQLMESAAGGEPCGEPAISNDSHHVSLVQWTTCLLPATSYTGSNPLWGLMWNRDSPVSDVSLQAFKFLMTWSFQPYASYRLSGPILDWEIVILILNWIGWGQSWPCWLWPQIAGKLIKYFIFQKISFPEEHLAKSFFTFNKTSKWHFDAHFNNITSKV
jgi:hypothetical protein